MSDLANIEGLPTSADFPDGVRRVRDTDLGKWLGYKEPRDCRKLVKRLIESKKLNGSDVRGVPRRIVIERPDQVSSKIPPVTREVVEFWLTRAQAQKVTVYSETPRGDEMLDLLIAVFERATEKQFSSDYLEARLLEFENRRKWEQLWDRHVVVPICKLYRWPTTNKNGTLYAPLAGVMRRLYILLLGAEVYNELKKRNPSPRQGNNHHQLLQKTVCDLVGEDLRIVAVIAHQSDNQRDFWHKLRRHFVRDAMLQTSIDFKRLGGKRAA